MTTRALYQRGRRSAPITDPNKPKSGRTKYDLIEKLRHVRNANDEAMTAIDEYNPDLCVNLSACTTEEDAEKLLNEWLARRHEILSDTQTRLRTLWRAAQANPKD